MAKKQQKSGKPNLDTKAIIEELKTPGLIILGMSVVSRLPVRQTGLVLGVGYGLLSVLWALALALLPQ